MKILFLSSWFPYPPINGAKIRTYNLMRQLSKNHEVTLLSFAKTIPVEKAREQIPWLKQYCREVSIVPYRPYVGHSLAAYRGFFSTKPRSVVHACSSDFSRLVKATVKSETYDLVLASEGNAPSVTSLFATQVKSVPVVLDGLETGLQKDAYYQESSMVRRMRHGVTWAKLRGFTRQVVRAAALCTVPSEPEKRNLLEIVPDHTRIEVVPHSLEVDRYTGSFGLLESKMLSFTGSFAYEANLDAARFLLQEIYPRLKARLPEVSLRIVGNLNGMRPESLTSDESVSFTGLVPDIRPVMASSWLSAVPLRVGAGTRLKIVESMALGTPVVSTSKGAEGLDVVHGESILLADDAETFTRAVVEVFQNPSLRERLSAGGRKLVMEKYSADVIGSNFCTLLEEVVRDSTRATARF